MSSSYFPYQPPSHIILLSMQQIPITTACGPSSAQQDEPSSYSSRKWINSPEACNPHTEAALEKKIQSSFATNLSEHQHEYLDQYVGKKVTSVQELDGGGKVQLDANWKLETIALPDKVKEHSKKKTIAKKKAISSKRKKASGRGEDGEE